MSRIRSRNTSPEMIVRRTVHKMGYRYRLHVAELPGKPDLVFPKLRRVIEVRGCFWHQHTGCIDAHIPKSRRGYWLPKLSANLRRDKENGLKLRKLGWRLLVIWECELGDSQRLSKRLTAFLGG
jgi:DNA mismatch endonuclease, patch repair protein